MSRYGDRTGHAMTIATRGPPMKAQYQGASRDYLRAIGTTTRAKAKPISRLVVADAETGDMGGRLGRVWRRHVTKGARAGPS
jgi:hypothetical protein